MENLILHESVDVHENNIDVQFIWSYCFNTFDGVLSIFSNFVIFISSLYTHTHTHAAVLREVNTTTLWIGFW